LHGTPGRTLQSRLSSFFTQRAKDNHLERVEITPWDGSRTPPRQGQGQGKISITRGDTSGSPLAWARPRDGLFIPRIVKIFSYLLSGLLRVIPAPLEVPLESSEERGFHYDGDIDCFFLLLFFFFFSFSLGEASIGLFGGRQECPHHTVCR